MAENSKTIAAGTENADFSLPAENRTPPRFLRDFGDGEESRSFLPEIPHKENSRVLLRLKKTLGQGKAQHAGGGRRNPGLGGKLRGNLSVENRRPNAAAAEDNIVGWDEGEPAVYFDEFCVDMRMTRIVKVQASGKGNDFHTE